MDKSAISVLAETIKTACQKIVNNASFDKTIGGVVTGTDNDKYIISMLGTTYTVSNGTNLTFATGNGVWVTIPCNKLSNAFIVAKR